MVHRTCLTSSLSAWLCCGCRIRLPVPTFLAIDNQQSKTRASALSSILNSKVVTAEVSGGFGHGF